MYTSQILPADRGRSDFLRAADTVKRVLGVATVEELVSSVKSYDFVVKLQALLTTNTTQYSFDPVKENTAAIVGNGPTDFRFNKNDVFAITGVGVRFKKCEYVSASGTTTNYGNYPEYTYPVASVFNGALEQAGLLAVVNGSIGISVQTDQQWLIPVSECVYKNAYVTATEQTVSYGPGPDGRGIFPLNSIVLMDGGSDNQVTLNLLTPAVISNIDGHLNSGGAAQNFRNIVEPVLYGFLFKNVAGKGFVGDLCRA